MFSKIGAKYHDLRHNHRYGFVLRYVTIVVGVLVTAVGVITIPYPGPGWAIVFLGLLILSQELEWAARLRRWIMDKLNTFYSRYIDGNLLAQILLGIATCAIVIATLWLTGALHLAAGWVGIDADWLASPLLG
ncbi:TIGR02611 family protein [Gordonia sp. HY442]|uniref:TIGR02611 family protein n=1 Tax=Gordonia zhenghanii TaxID=2911516 RepID=UPI001F032969|nr:TIGR02611 family protein [Gordonia zhenghanii]MCF8601961.1 TIGR02611 family protein [Gordonia zhenghanii]MCF8602029.1 TIGR02611 family protein [Gordonia zhenghanii]